MLKDMPRLSLKFVQVVPSQGIAVIKGNRLSRQLSVFRGSTTGRCLPFIPLLWHSLLMEVREWRRGMRYTMNTVCCPILLVMLFLTMYSEFQVYCLHYWYEQGYLSMLLFPTLKCSLDDTCFVMDHFEEYRWMT